MKKCKFCGGDIPKCKNQNMSAYLKKKYCEIQCFHKSRRRLKKNVHPK